MFDASLLDLFTMNLFTKLLALARVIHESSALPTLFCRLTFTPLIESVLYKIWTQAHRSPFLNLFHAALYLSLGPLSSHFSLLYTIISHQILSSLQHTVSYASKQEKKKKKRRRTGEGSQIHITFCVFACQVINGRWVEVKSGSIFIFPSSVSFHTRHGSTCKLAAKGEVENNYGSDAAREKWVYCLTCNEVESWQAGFVRLADLNARKWLFCTVNQQEKIANYKCRAPPAAWQAYWWPRVAVHVWARMNINANILDESH